MKSARRAPGPREGSEPCPGPSRSRRASSSPGPSPASTSSRLTCAPCWTGRKAPTWWCSRSSSRSSCSRPFRAGSDLPASELTRIHAWGNTRYTEDYRRLFESEARERGQHIAAGSHLEKKDGRYLNVAYLYGPDGLVHCHDKTHIFPAEAEWHTEEGDTIEMVELPFARVGFNVCYEAEIPECAASLAEQGAEIILCPSFTFTEHGFWRVRHCAQARAVENQVYVVHCGGSAELPAGGPLPSPWGRSAILSPCDTPWDAPNGVVAEAPAPNIETVVRGEVDLDRLHENRESGAAPTFRDRRRRAGLYRDWPSHVDA